MSYDYHVQTVDRPRPQYFAVSKTKFVIMSFMTLGIYELYWFYRNWCFIRDRDGISIRPFWRAFFAPLFLRGLMSDVDEHRGTVAAISTGQAGFLFLAYLVLNALWRLPDPYWLVSMFSWAALLPVVAQIAAVNRPCQRELLRNSEWKFKHVVLGVVMLPMLGVVITSTLNVTPSTQVVSGSRMWEHNVDFLRHAGMLDKNEEVLFFYSQGLLSMEEEGNVLTDSRAVSYWTDEDTGELLVETALYDEIASVETEYSDTFSDHTVITVERRDGSSFLLVVSSEENRDLPFVDALESRIH